MNWILDSLHWMPTLKSMGPRQNIIQADTPLPSEAFTGPNSRSGNAVISHPEVFVQLGNTLAGVRECDIAY